MATLFGMFPFLKKLFADSAYQGPKFAKALEKVLPHLDIKIVKRSDQVSGFVVLPKHWIVERTIAWLNRCRRLGQGLGKSQPQGPGILASRLHPPHAQKTLQSGLKSPDKLLEAAVALGMLYLSFLAREDPLSCEKRAAHCFVRRRHGRLVRFVVCSELLQVRDHVRYFLILFQTREDHLCARDELGGRTQIVGQGLRVPDQA